MLNHSRSPYEVARIRRDIGMSAAWTRRKNFAHGIYGVIRMEIWYWERVWSIATKRQERKDEACRNRLRHHRRRNHPRYALANRNAKMRVGKDYVKYTLPRHITPSMLYSIATRRRNVGIARAWRRRRNIVSAILEIVAIEANYRALLKDLDNTEFG